MSPHLAICGAALPQEGSMTATRSGTDLSFEASLALSAPPGGWSLPLRALWFVEKGDWHGAHQLAQQDERDPASTWVHAHLHRVEGDDWNARYWYRRAGQPEAAGDFAAERRQIAAALLAVKAQ
jgi:hypothetical protein